MSAHRFRWLVLYTRPRYEKKVHAQLVEWNVQCYLPLRTETKQWSDRKKEIELPLFSGYIFVFVSERERIQALQADGAMKYIMFGGKIAEVSEEVIQSIKLAMTRPENVRLEETTLRLGQKVRVRFGPMKGMVGHLVEFRGNTRVAIHVEAIQQILSVEVPIADLGIKPLVSAA